MRPIRPIACLTLTFALALSGLAGTGAAGAQSTPTAVTGVQPPTPIAAWQGRLVWSRPDGKGGYQLVQQIGSGAVQVLPIASRGVPFDVDLGPTSSGGVYAVYSRCHIEPTWDGTEGMPAYEQGKGCDVYKLDLATGTEVRYTKVNASDGTEYWPSYWKGTIAFARAYDSKPAQPYLYSKVIASSAPSQRQPGGSRGSAASTPLEIELYGTRIGFGWRYHGSQEAPAYDLRVDTIGGGHVRLDETPGGGLSSTQIGWPSFENGRVYWLRSCVGDPGGCETTRRFEQSNYTGHATAADRDLAGLRAGARARPGHHVGGDGRQLDLRVPE